VEGGGKMINVMQPKAKSSLGGLTSAGSTVGPIVSRINPLILKNDRK
jgi:hypothetical protein